MENERKLGAAVWAFICALAILVGLVSDALGIVDFFRDWIEDKITPIIETTTPETPAEEDEETPSEDIGFTTAPSIHSEKHYEYREKEYTESTEPTLSGWTQYKRTEETNLGEFSPWQYTPLVDDAENEVQSTVHYQWRTLREEPVFGEWSEWTTERRQDIADNVEERSETYLLNDDGTSTGIRYSYREITTQTVPSSDWFYNSSPPDPIQGLVEVIEVTAYRSRPVRTTITYHYWKWSEWKECSETDYSEYQTDTEKEVRITD